MYVKARTGSDPGRLLAAAATVVVTIVSYSPTVQRALFSLGDTCALHRATGLRCPACGLTHATLAIAHGDLVRGMRLNLLALPVLLLVGTALVRWRWPRPLVLGTVAAGVVYAVVRNL